MMTIDVHSHEAKGELFFDFKNILLRPFRVSFYQ